jgi:hypothetical protein
MKKITIIRVFLFLLSFYMLTRSFPHPGRMLKIQSPDQVKSPERTTKSAGNKKNAKKCEDDFSFHTYGQVLL